MACPNCDHTMQQLAVLVSPPHGGVDYRVFWCPRCGTVKDCDGKSTPMLVGRVLEFCGGLKDHWQIMAEIKRLGIHESITLPGQRGKGSGATRDKPDSVSRAQGTSDQGGYVVGSHINVSFAFRGGNYEGSARIVRVDSGELWISFPWNNIEKYIQISKSEVVI